MSTQEPIEKLLEGYERMLLEPATRKSETISQLLAESFVEFGSSGRVFTKTQVVALLQAEPPMQVAASEFKVRLLAPQIALVTYRTRRHPEPPTEALHSSIWEQRQGKWQMIFHQGTPTQIQT